jgi:hypothetical protein
MKKHFHVPGKPYMTNYERAGQFMPFMSLKGFDELIGDSTDQIVNKEWVHIEFNDDVLYDLDRFQDDDGDGEKFLER